MRPALKCTSVCFPRILPIPPHPCRMKALACCEAKYDLSCQPWALIEPWAKQTVKEAGWGHVWQARPLLRLVIYAHLNPSSDVRRGEWFKWIPVEGGGKKMTRFHISLAEQVWHFHAKSLSHAGVAENRVWVKRQHLLSICPFQRNSRETWRGTKASRAATCYCPRAAITTLAWVHTHLLRREKKNPIQHPP